MPETQKTRQSFRPQPMLKAAGRTILTAGIVAAAAASGLAGYGALAARATNEPDAEAAPPTPVVATPLRMQAGYSVARRFGGQFEAPRETALGFEEGGSVAEVGVREGDRVTAGAVLARADTRLLASERLRLEATRSALVAQTELARRTNERQTALSAAGHLSQQRLDDSSLTLARLESEIAAIDAGLAAIDVRLAKARIVAPFAGVVGRRLLDEGAVAAPGAPVVTLLEFGTPRFRAAVDPALADTLAPGDRAVVTTSAGDLPARVARLSPDLDPSTRARIVFFDVDGGAPARATGEVTIRETVALPGAWVPLSALRQGPRGTWTLLTVEPSGKDHVIGLETAEVLDLAEGRAYIRGSVGEGDLYLPDGTHRVVPGETVSIARDDGSAPQAKPPEPGDRS